MHLTCLNTLTKTEVSLCASGKSVDHAYSREAIAFFMRCRERMQAPLKTLVRWALDCEETIRADKLRCAILGGQLGRRLLNYLRKQQ